MTALTHDGIHEQNFSLADVWWELGIVNPSLVCVLVTLNENLADTYGSTAISQAFLHSLSWESDTNYSVLVWCIHSVDVVLCRWNTSLLVGIAHTAPHYANTTVSFLVLQAFVWFPCTQNTPNTSAKNKKVRFQSYVKETYAETFTIGLLFLRMQNDNKVSLYFPFSQLYTLYTMFCSIKNLHI